MRYLPNAASSSRRTIGKRAQDVAHFFPGQAVEVEVKRVEAGLQVTTLLFVPYKGGTVVAEVAGEGRHVMGGVREPENVVADEVTGSRRAEWEVVIAGCDDGELFDYVQIQSLPVNFLSGNEVERHAVEVPPKSTAQFL